MLSKTNKPRSLVKVIAISVAILVTIYITMWFIAAEMLKNKLETNVYEGKDWNLSFEGHKVSGFPLKLKVNLVNTKFSFNREMPPLKADVFFDIIKIETGPLLTHIDFTLPKKISIDLNIGEISAQVDMLTKSTHYLKLTESSFLNTHKVFQLLSSAKSDFNLSNLGLEKLQYKAKDSYVIDRKAQKELMRSDTDLEIEIQEKSDGVERISYKSNNVIDFLASEYIGHNFNRITFKSDASLDTKKEGDNRLEVLGLDLKLLELGVDKSKIILSGSSEKQKDQSMKTEINLKLVEWNLLTQELLVQKLISLEQYNILSEAVREAVGQDVFEETSIKIYSDKNGLIHIGKSDIYDLNNAVLQFMHAK